MTDPDALSDEQTKPMPAEPPLHRAARTGDHDAIRVLVARGVDINLMGDLKLDTDSYDRPATPLMAAAGSGDGASVETVRLLLELGADPTLILDAESAATFACTGLGWGYRSGGDTDRLRLLLEHGAPLPRNPARANRLLCDTAKGGDAQRVATMLDHGLAANGHSDAEEARTEARDMMQTFSSCGETQADPLASVPEDLRQSMDDAWANVEREMCEQQASAPWSGQIPLHCAAESGNAECIGVLLRAGADPLKRDNQKRTAMYHATTVEAVRALLEAGLPIEDADAYESSPLDSAVSDGEEGVERARALIECGANVNATHDRGYTVFMSAVGSNRYQPMLRLLVEAGADPHAVSEYGDNAFHAAIDVNFEANEDSSVRSTLAYLRDLGVDIEHRSKNGHTPLARAIAEGTGTEVRVLCELGADPDAVCPMRNCRGGKCKNIDMPLLHAAADGTGVDSDEKVGAMLKASADPLVQDSEGYTPLVRVVATLCSNAEEYDAAFRSFYEGLQSLNVAGGSVPPEREAYLAQAMPDLRAYVQRFAAGIPIPTRSEFEQEWRDRRIECIVLLAAHEGWARWQHIARKRANSG
jgi:ankyrin repeat protein